MAHRTDAASTTNEWNFSSISVHAYDPYEMGLNIAPFRSISKRHSPVLSRCVAYFIDSSSSAGSIKIHAIPSVLQSVLINVGLSGSKCESNGEDVIEFFISKKSS